ncbi:MAG: TMEM43 family protein [Chloroflexales bacterium]
MSDSYTEVTSRGWLGNLLNSFVAALIGGLLFIAAFPVIWIGEGRTNLADVAATSVVARTERADVANEGKLIAVTGALEANPLGDSPYLQPGAYLRVERIAEMYAWVETTRTETRDRAGGGTTTETTYTYSKQWTSSPESGSGFHISTGHRNPAMEFSSATLSATGGTLGAYGLDLKSLDLPSAQDLPLRPAMIGMVDGIRLTGNYLLMGRSSLDTPQVGDVRISYKVLSSGKALTVFGTQHGQRIDAYLTPKGDRLYRGLEGDRAAAIHELQVEDTIMDWVIRIGSLLMMWVGLSMLLGPINAAFGLLPFMRQAGGCLIGLITLAVSLPIWGATVLVAIIAHNIWLMIGVALLVMGGAFFFLRRRGGATA